VTNSDISWSVGALTSEEWHEILGRFQDGMIQQTWSYAAARWPRATLNHLVVERNSTIVAAAQVVLLRLPIIGGGLAYVHFGPLWQPYEQAAVEEHFRLAIECLRKEFVDKRRMVLRVRPQPVLDAKPDFITPLLVENGFEHSRNFPVDRYLVDLSPPLEDIRMGLHGKWRYNLKVSQRKDLEIAHVRGEQALDLFLSLYGEMLSRKAFDDDSSIGELKSFYLDLPTSLTPEVLLCRYRGEEISGAVVSRVGDKALYLYGASRDRALALRAGYFLQWSIIKWLREQHKSCRWYDLGGDSGSPGLRSFKIGLVGSCGRVVSLPGDFEMCRNLANLVGVRLAFRVRDLYLKTRKRFYHTAPS
jgi:hypothetical protein